MRKQVTGESWEGRGPGRAVRFLRMSQKTYPLDVSPMLRNHGVVRLSQKNGCGVLVVWDAAVSLF